MDALYNFINNLFNQNFPTTTWMAVSIALVPAAIFMTYISGWPQLIGYIVLFIYSLVLFCILGIVNQHIFGLWANVLIVLVFLLVLIGLLYTPKSLVKQLPNPQLPNQINI